MILSTLTAALASTPAVEIGWKGDDGRFVMMAPEGFEISPDAPADLTLRWEGREMSVSGFGAELTNGIAVGAIRGNAVEGNVAMQLCNKSDGVCTPAEFALSGAIPGAKKGRVSLTVAEAAHDDASHGPTFNNDASAVADEAFAAAKASDDLVILDFSAVWCPPCNLLAAEVLHAPDADTMLEGFQLAVLDVDHESSFVLKDRYTVGGYPTVVVVDAEGKELDRVVGYPGKEEFLTFLAQANEEKKDWAATDPGTLSADDAAEGWWAQVANGSDADLEAWQKAAAGSDSAEAHLAGFRTKANADDAAWLAENAPETTLEWLPWSGPWSDEDEAQAPLKAAIQNALPEADGIEAADLLAYAAQLADEADQPTMYGAAYATLKASLTDDPLLDRAHWTFLASLQAKSGDVDGAIAFLDGLTRSHPDDPTFLLKAANLLNDHERYEDALKRSKMAMGRSWGDNQLRVALAHCKALKGLGRDAEARGTAEKLLNQDAGPGEDLKVRTHRYREKLAAFLEE